MSEAAALENLSVVVEYTDVVKPSPQIDTNKNLEVTLVHEHLLTASCVMFHQPLYWRSRRNSPQDVHHIELAGTHVHPRRSKRRAKSGVTGK
jgi:hypothetical protein